MPGKLTEAQAGQMASMKPVGYGADPFVQQNMARINRAATGGATAEDAEWMKTLAPEQRQAINAEYYRQGGKPMAGAGQGAQDQYAAAQAARMQQVLQGLPQNAYQQMLQRQGQTQVDPNPMGTNQGQYKNAALGAQIAKNQAARAPATGAGGSMQPGRGVSPQQPMDMQSWINRYYSNNPGMSGMGSGMPMYQGGNANIPTYGQTQQNPNLVAAKPMPNAPGMQPQAGGAPQNQNTAMADWIRKQLAAKKQQGGGGQMHSLPYNGPQQQGGGQYRFMPVVSQKPSDISAAPAQTLNRTAIQPTNQQYKMK